MLISEFKSLNLLPQILNALERKGYVNPTPIQAQAIPNLLAGKDLLGIAQTGTGKTAAFSLPILHNLASNNKNISPRKIRALILTPTRELASQIADNIEVYGKGLALKSIVIFGGVNENPQISALQKGVDIVIATPGRLLDLTKQGYVNYQNVEVLVLDEADRMLDMGFINDIKQIIAKLPKNRQTLLFSATMPKAISDLAYSVLNNPVRVEIAPESTTVEKIDQKVCFVEKGNKNLLLKDVLERSEVKSVLVFCKMKHGANRVVEFLEKNNIRAEAIHGNKSQPARERALQRFRDGDCKVLVATDIAARGLDIPSVTHVINFDIPQEPESYVHRIGRTARAGRDGVAIAFCEPMERSLLKAVEKAIKRPIPVDNSHSYFGVANSAPVARKISSANNNKLAIKEERKVFDKRLISRSEVKTEARTEARVDSKTGVRAEVSERRSERNYNQGDYNSNKSERRNNSSTNNDRFNSRRNNSLSQNQDSSDYSRSRKSSSNGNYKSDRLEGGDNKNKNRKRFNKFSTDQNSPYAKKTSFYDRESVKKNNRSKKFSKGSNKKSSTGIKSKFGKIVGWFKNRKQDQ